MEKELIIMEAQELGVNRKNWEVYNAYLTSKAIQSKETVQTTYKTYFNNVKLFFRYLKAYENNRYISIFNCFLWAWRSVYRMYAVDR